MGCNCEIHFKKDVSIKKKVVKVNYSCSSVRNFKYFSGNYTCLYIITIILLFAKTSLKSIKQKLNIKH